MAEISIIVPVYNDGGTLAKCLDSLCSQTFADLEIICVNDASDDMSPLVLEEYAKKDTRIRVISLDGHHGAGFARNRGIELATGNYTALVDADDYVDANFYQTLHLRAKETGADIAKGNLIFEGFAEEYDNSEYHNFRDLAQSKLLLNHVPTLLIKSSLIRNNEIRFQENVPFLEDCVFELSAAYYANAIECVPGTSYHYIHYPDSLNHRLHDRAEKISGLPEIYSCLIRKLDTFAIEKTEYLDVLKHRTDSLREFIRQSCPDAREAREILHELEKIAATSRFPKELTATIQFPECADETAKASEKSFHMAPGPIPRRIFYVWAGWQKKGKLDNICIESWRDILRDYEIIEINESGPYFDFQNEYRNCRWFREVYDRKLWAYASDYMRCVVLYNHGGIYLDTDVTAKKDLEPLLPLSCFLGYEDTNKVGVSVIGSVRGHRFLADMIDFYRNRIFADPLYIMPDIATRLVSENDYQDLTIYPREYFYPFYYNEEFTPECVTENTYAIHWWNASWWKNEKGLDFLGNKQQIPEAPLYTDVLVSVIIPVYNVAEYLGQCLESVLAQTHGNLEIICVNDASRDNSLVILEEFAAKDCRIKIFSHTGNRGLSSARNTGLKKATGEFVYFLDSDDWIAPNYIGELVRAIKRHDCDLVLNTNIISVNGNKYEPYFWPRFSLGFTESRMLDTAEAIDESHVMVWCHLYRRSFLMEFALSFPDCLIHEDEYFHHVTLINAKRLFAYNGAPYFYRQRASSIMSGADSIIPYILIAEHIISWHEFNPGLDLSEIPIFYYYKLPSIKTVTEFQAAREFFFRNLGFIITSRSAIPYRDKFILRQLLCSPDLLAFRERIDECSATTLITSGMAPLETPKVSVIVTCHNAEARIDDCLQYLFFQTLEELEILCVDDASTDATASVIEKFAELDKRIKLIKNPETRGPGYSRNLGIANARGEYIGFVDSDDYVDFDYYKKLYDRGLEQRADISLGNIKYLVSGKAYSDPDLPGKICASKFSLHGLIPLAIYRRGLLKGAMPEFQEDFSGGVTGNSVARVVHATLAIAISGDCFYWKRLGKNVLAGMYCNYKGALADLPASAGDFYATLDVLAISPADYAVIANEYLDYILDSFARAQDEECRLIFYKTFMAGAYRHRHLARKSHIYLGQSSDFENFSQKFSELAAQKKLLERRSATLRELRGRFLKQL